jgi:hypothetical protein
MNMEVTVPADAKPGQKIQVQAADGSSMTVEIPPNVAPGEKFQVQMPASQGGRKQSNPNSLFGRFNRAMSDVNKKMHKAAGEATKKFHAVTTQCPQCSTVVNVTKENAKEKFFTCPQCSATIQTPESTEKVSYHTAKLTDKITGAINKAVGQDKDPMMSVTVPEGMGPGSVRYTKRA